mmetsp:Transcript_31533/g.84172  ORF Transcript_31533/g.84172 Transcript_31533/m.84172 type:complete len:206 (+) Transcript_31533:486-1103(+)
MFFTLGDGQLCGNGVCEGHKSEPSVLTRLGVHFELHLEQVTVVHKVLLDHLLCHGGIEAANKDLGVVGRFRRQPHGYRTLVDYVLRLCQSGIASGRIFELNEAETTTLSIIRAKLHTNTLYCAIVRKILRDGFLRCIFCQTANEDLHAASTRPLSPLHINNLAIYVVLRLSERVLRRGCLRKLHKGKTTILPEIKFCDLTIVGKI